MTEPRTDDTYDIENWRPVGLKPIPPLFVPDERTVVLPDGLVVGDFSYFKVETE